MIPKLGKTHKNLQSTAKVPPCAKGLVYALQQCSGSIPSLQNGISHDDRTNFTMKVKTRSNSLSSYFYEVKEICRFQNAVKLHRHKSVSRIQRAKMILHPVVWLES